MTKEEIIQEIKWKADSWTDGLSYESMSKIAELMDSEVGE